MKNIYKILFFCWLLVQSSVTFCQTFPDAISSDGLILHGRVSSKLGIESKDHTTIYTINWFIPDAMFSGKGDLPDSIPILTRGGITDKGLLVVTHTPEIHNNYNYMVALEPCENCITHMKTWQISALAGEFDDVNYIQARKKWAQKGRLNDIPKDKCGEDKPTLFISFGNIHLTPSFDSITGYLDVKFRTDLPDKALYSISTQLKYKTNVLGEYAINAQNISVAPSDNAFQLAYSSSCSDITNEKAGFDMVNNGLTGTAIQVEATNKSFARIRFRVSLQGLLNLPHQVSDLFTLENLQASYICDRKIFPFNEIKIDENPIGVVIDGLSPSITYTFDDVEYNSTTNKYQFTIFAASEFDTRLIQAGIYVDYSSFAFFPNQFSSGLAVVLNQPGTIATDYPEYDPIVGDADNDRFGIFLGSTNPITPEPLAFLGPDPKPLIRIEMTIDDCNLNPELEFAELEMQEISYFDDNTMPFYLTYDPVIASDNEQVLPCNCNDVKITSFSPAEIVAGDNQVLTITGSGFGVFQRSTNPTDDGTMSTVLFENGDYVSGLPGGPPEYTVASKEDIISWSDTEIKVKVPSTNYIGDKSTGPASTGKIKVRNWCNEDDRSDDKLLIPHSFMNYRLSTDGVSKPLGLRKNNGANGEQDGYVFSFHSSISSAVFDVKDVFRDALNTWCPETNIKFKTTDNPEPLDPPTFNDGRNSVTLGGLSSPDAQAAVLFSQAYFSIDCNGSLPIDEDGGFIMTDLDVIIKGSYATDINVSASRRKRVFEHELGHAHMLNHAYCFGGGILGCSGPLMHPQGETGIKDVDISGGNTIFDRSAKIINNNSCIGGSGTPIPIESGNCGDIVATHNVLNNLSEISPNPVSDWLKIKNVNKFSTYRICNSTGVIFVNEDVPNEEFQVDLTLLKPGYYLLILEGDDIVSYSKIVKI
jgi:hypothetical protein